MVVEFTSQGWQSWDVERQPLIRDGMPILVDEDLRFADDGQPRPAAVANRWLQELPVSGAPSPRTWRVYAQVLRAWIEFLSDRGVDLFDSRTRLRAVLSAYAGHRFSSDLKDRWDSATWNLHVTVLSRFYRWAVDEGLASAVPFTYSLARRFADGYAVEVVRNNARLRSAKPHSTIKYLEDDFVTLFENALAGLHPNGGVDERFRGRELGRNAAVGRAVTASGLRRQEFSYLLTYEIPPLPNRRTVLPVPFPVGKAVTKGAKDRATWIDYDALAEVHHYIALERSSAADGFIWRPPARLGAPLHVEEPDWEGAHIDGVRRPWRLLSPPERLRLVSPEGGSCLLALQSTGAPFTDWATVFRRTSDRIRERFEPRFPNVSPHRLRHSFAMRTLARLVEGYYQQAAALVRDTDRDADAALALYLTKSDPLSVLRDLLGHSSVTTTEIYLRSLDVTRIYRDAYTKATENAGLVESAEAAAESDQE